jgi:hypothetical protein
MKTLKGFLLALGAVLLMASGANRYINGTEIPRNKTLLYSDGAQSATLGATAVSGALTVSGNGGITGTLAVTGAVTMRSTLDVTGAVSASGITNSGNSTVTGALAVTGATTLRNADVLLSSVAAGVTADVGSAQGNGAMTTLATQVTTSASAGDAVTLPTPAAGKLVVVCNAAAANAIDAFPPAGVQVNKESANTAIALAAGECMFCMGFSATRWGCVIGSAN